MSISMLHLIFIIGRRSDDTQGKRKLVSRTTTVKVANVGDVQVLNANNYSLESGEPSVFEKEFRNRRNSSMGANQEIHPEEEHEAYVFIPKGGKQVAGRDYDSFDHCQVCLDGGTLILCDICPNAFHLKCLGLKKVLVISLSVYFLIYSAYVATIKSYVVMPSSCKLN